MILRDIHLDDEKYAKFDSPSENSEEDERVMNVSNEDIEAIVESVQKEPQEGKITFISKIIRSKTQKEGFRVVKVKGIGVNLPQVIQIKTMGNFSIY